MIHFEERYQNKHGIWVDRLKEMNYNQVVASVDERYRSFIMEYIIAWYCFTKRYQQDLDPKKNYTSVDTYNLRKEELYPQIKHDSAIGALRRVDPGARELERMMRLVDESMIHRLQEHYKQHEYGPLPSPSQKLDLRPCTPAPDWEPRYNAELLVKAQTFVIGPLLLSWSTSNGHTSYEIHLIDGRLLRKLEPVHNGSLRRFKDPVKRHAAAIQRVQEIATLMDWSQVDTLSHKQQRYLWKLVTERQRLEITR